MSEKRYFSESDQEEIATKFSSFAETRSGKMGLGCNYSARKTGVEEPEEIVSANKDIDTKLKNLKAKVAEISGKNNNISGDWMRKDMNNLVQDELAII